MGGQDWPKAIHALEQEAILDKNRDGYYLCVFGITIERGERYIKHMKKTNHPHSFNTEVWLADYFWPFFSNHTYQEIVNAVLNVLIESHKPIASEDLLPPNELVESFGACCHAYGLVDEQGFFNNPFHTKFG